MSQVADGTAEVSLLAEDEGKLKVAVGLVEKWVGQQQVKYIADSSLAAYCVVFLRI